MSEFLMPQYRLPDVQPQGRLPLSQGIEAPAGAFGGYAADALKQAGAALDKGSDALNVAAQREMALANKAVVDDAVQKYTEARNNALFMGDNAYLRTQGKTAINGAPGFLDTLKGLKDAAVGGAKNPVQQQMIGERLNAIYSETSTLVGRHVSEQSLNWQKEVAAGTQTMAQSNAATQWNDDAYIDQQRSDAKQGALHTALLQGLTDKDGKPDTANPAVQALLMSADSGVVKAAVMSRLANNQPRAALALYDRVADQSGLKSDPGLGHQMEGIRAQIKSFDVANDALAKSGMPPLPDSDGGSRENNIGNVRPKGGSNGFQTYQTFDQGVAATVQNVRSYPKAFNNGQPMTLTQIGQRWAPKGDGANDPAQWAKNVGATAGIDPNTPINLDDPAVAAKVARGIHAAEWGGNKIKDVSAYNAGTNMAFGAAPQSPFKGDAQQGFQSAIARVSADDSLSPQEKTDALALLNKQRTALQGYTASAVKSLQDEERSTLGQAFGVNPSALKPGTISGWADRARQLGENEMATRYDTLALLEPTIRAGIQNAPDDQRKMIEALTQGLPKDILQGLRSPQAGADAVNRYGLLKKKFEGGLGLSPDEVKAVVTDLANSGKSTEAREAATWGSAALTASEVFKANPQAQQKFLSDLDQSVKDGQSTDQKIVLHDILTTGFQHQAEQFGKDAFTAGTSLYPEVGPPVQLDWTSADPATLDTQLRMRWSQAQQISTRRGGIPVAPFSEQEFSDMRSRMATADPATQSSMMRALSRLPADAVPLVAQGLAGKHDSGDPLSRSYASALGLFSEHDPAADTVADQVLRGAALIKNGGEGVKKAAMTSPTWDTTFENRVGNALKDLPPQAKAMLSDAVASVYTYQMSQSGKEGASLDGDVLDRSIKTVIGDSFAINGQTVIPPRGVDRYRFDAGLRTLTDGDLNGAKTTDGSEITADLIKRKGVLSNVGDGLYQVRVPDPRRGGDLGNVVDPSTGRNLVLNMNDLLRRTTGPTAGLAVAEPTPADAAIRARRQAPASPTAGVDPIGAP